MEIENNVTFLIHWIDKKMLFNLMSLFIVKKIERKSQNENGNFSYFLLFATQYINEAKTGLIYI